MGSNNPLWVFFKKLICYCLIFQITFFDIVRASSTDLREDQIDDTSPLMSQVSVRGTNPVSYGSLNDVTGGINDPLDTDERTHSNQEFDENNNPFILIPSGLNDEGNIEKEITAEIRRLWRQKALVEITPFDILIISISVSLGITALQAWEALTAAGAFDVLGIPTPESDEFGAFYASTAAVHFVMFSGLVPFVYSSVKAGDLLLEGGKGGYKEIKAVFKKIVKHLRKELADQETPQAWRKKSWSVVVLEVFNLICSTTYSLILVGILKRIEHKYPEFYKIFGGPLAVTTFLDKITSGHVRALKTSRQIMRESADIAEQRKTLRVQILKVKKYLAGLNEEMLFQHYKRIFPGYLNIFPFPVQRSLSPQVLTPDEFDLRTLNPLFQEGQFQKIEESQTFRILSGISTVTAVYGLWSVMFQSLETMLGYNGALYVPAIISGGWIAYTEYDEIKELVYHFKEKISHWGRDTKKKLIVCGHILSFSFLMFISFIFSYSEFDEARHPDEVKHGFASFNRNKVFNWFYTVPLLVFEMLSFTHLQSVAYGAFSFFVNSFSKRSVTKASSYRERLIALMDSLIEVTDQVSANGLQVIDGIVNRQDERLDQPEAEM
ncbi:MAG: hypothetical protein BGO77_05600 [Caedibacter sp. 37-49]|nr:MAG: hypothetical protein BGO77_05600 [Caedibacter sp. 37-49]